MVSKPLLIVVNQDFSYQLLIGSCKQRDSTILNKLRALLKLYRRALRFRVNAGDSMHFNGLAKTTKVVSALSLVMGLMVGTSSVQAKDLIIERSYSKSKIEVPLACEEQSLRPICSRLVNYYTRRFEREMVIRSNANINVEEDFDLSSSFKTNKAFQHIKMAIYTKEESPIFTLFSILNQTFVDGTKVLQVETINFDKSNNEPVDFNTLFEKPELAAMLCARAIEANYSKYKSPNLQIAISATELRPTNYLISPKGLRFFFAPGLVTMKKDKKNTDSLLVPIAQLMPALPKDKWWPVKEFGYTEEEKQALAKSGLSGSINLEKDEQRAQIVQGSLNQKQAYSQAKTIGQQDRQGKSLEPSAKEEVVTKNQ